MPAKRKQPITSRALLEIKSPADLAVSLDGTRVAFVVSEVDWDEFREVQHVFVSTACEEAAARQVTQSEGYDDYPLWSPDGKNLAFLRTIDIDDEDDDETDDGEARAQVWILPMDGFGGEADKLTDALEGVEIYEWLPDSSGIVYVTREPRVRPLQTAYEDRLDDKDDAIVDRDERFRRQIWRIDLEKKKARLVHAGDYGLGEIAVSPDGGQVAFSTNYTGEANDYHLVDIWTVAIDGKSDPIRLTCGPGGKFHPRWSPDSSRVYFARTLDPGLSYSQESLYSVEAGPPSDSQGRLSYGQMCRGQSESAAHAADNDAVCRQETDGFPHELTGWRCWRWSGDGTLYVLAALGTTTAIFRRTTEGFEPVIRRDEHIQEFDVANDGSIAFISTAANDPAEVYFLPSGRSADKDIRPLSDINGDWALDYRPSPVDLATWAASDGVAIEGLLTLPDGPEEPRPLILSLHGGPHGRSVQSLTTNALPQLLAARGYAVLEPNYRGSEGYGNDFSVAVRGDLGGRDFQDVLDAVQWAIAEGIAIPERIGVIGSSYGGYLAAWAVARTRLFRAAVTQFGISSFVTDFSHSEAPRWEMDYLGGAFWEQPDLYRDRSALTYVHQIDAPVLIMHGDADSNTFISNSIELYNALRLQGKTVQLVRYPREGHGFAEPRHRLDEMRRCVAWFDRHVRGDLAQPSPYGVGDKVMYDGWELTVVRAGSEIYDGHESPRHRYVEIRFALRDTTDNARSMAIAPIDLVLVIGSRRLRPSGLSVDVLGKKSLVESSRWQQKVAPAKDEKSAVGAVSVAFKAPNSAAVAEFILKDFPSVAFEITATD